MARLMVILCCASIVFAGCGTAETDQPATTTTQPPSTTIAVAQPPQLAPCDLVTAAEVAAATGLEVVEVRDEPPISCIFDLGEVAGVEIFVHTDDGEGRSLGAKALYEAYEELLATGSGEAVDDLGGPAIYIQGFRGLAINPAENVFISIGVSGGYAELSEPRDVLIAIATVVLDRLQP